jgi:hypothetical protein
MTRARIILAAVSALTLLGTAAQVYAQAPHNGLTLTADDLSGHDSAGDQNRWAPQNVHKSVEWDAKKRWGLKLDLSEPVGRDMQLRDVQAGAYFKVTPSLRVGGAVALGDSTAPDHTTPLPQTTSPRVRLETNFKF